MSERIESITGSGAVFGGFRDELVEPASAPYRYRLWRKLRTTGTQRVCFVMLNPSTADHTVDDPTIRRCIGFAERAGAGYLEVVNLFGFRATNPAQLATIIADVVGHENDVHVEEAARASDLVICAWGTKVPKRPASFGRVQIMLELLRKAGHPTVYCLGETKDGHPKHPLYLAAETPLEVYAR